MSNSPLVTCTVLSPNHSGARTHKIDTITIHHMSGVLTAAQCGNVFLPKSRQASSNYGIGNDGSIGLYVPEAYRSWCTSSRDNDQRAVTIEVSNSKAAEPWPVSDAAYKSLINLLVDICKRNGIPKLLWRNDKSLMGQVDKQNMTVHRWFASTDCPGTYLMSRMGQIAGDVNARLGKKEENKTMTEAEIRKLVTETVLGMDVPATAKNAAQDVVQSVFTRIYNNANPLYTSVGQIPDYWRQEVEEMIQCGAIKGDGTHEISIRREALQAAVIALRACATAGKCNI